MREQGSKFSRKKPKSHLRPSSINSALEAALNCCYHCAQDLFTGRKVRLSSLFNSKQRAHATKWKDCRRQEGPASQFAERQWWRHLKKSYPTNRLLRRST
eukprot:1233895-Pleurochrysis_carterae.AAC.3